MSFANNGPYVNAAQMKGNANLGASLAVANLASGGALGTAATTVDLYNIFLLTQTTASQTVSIPSPTAGTAAAGQLALVANVGNQSVTILSTTVAASKAIWAVWSGAAWIPQV